MAKRLFVSETPKGCSGFAITNPSARDLTLEFPEVPVHTGATTLRRGSLRPTSVVVRAQSSIDLAAILGVPATTAAEIWEARGGHPILRATLRTAPTSRNAAQRTVRTVQDGRASAGLDTNTADAEQQTPSATEPQQRPPPAPPKPPKPPVKRGRIAGRPMSASSLSSPQVRKAALRELGPDERVRTSEDQALLEETKATSGLDAGFTASLDATTPSVRWDKAKLLEFARAKNVNVTDDMPKNTILRKIREKIG